MTTIKTKDGSGNLLYPAGYYDDPRTLTEGEQKAWASNIGVSGIGLSEGENPCLVCLPVV